MNPQVQKALKWVLRSGAMTAFLLGLSALLQALQGYDISLRDFGFGVLILVINGVVNLLDYWRHERKA